MTNYVLVDTNNLFHRVKHVSKGPTELRVGVGLHTIILSIRKMWNKFDADHLVFGLEGKSWRRSVFTEYKAARRSAQANIDTSTQEMNEIFEEVTNDFIRFLRKRTNCTVLQSVGLEADDLIAGWVQTHPNDTHIIISGDSDFEQLISENVKLYNPIKKELYAVDGVYDDNGNKITDKKTGKFRKIDPEYSLFLKCIRGDKSDGIFSAYPGVYETRIKDAYDDRSSQGWDWIKLMESEWLDHNNIKHKVKEDYEFNKTLIDLTAQPVEIRKLMQQVIQTEISQPQKSQVGIFFMRFCESYKLESIKKVHTTFSSMFSAKYPGNADDLILLVEKEEPNSV